MELLSNGSPVEPHFVDQSNTSNNQLVLGLNNGMPIVAWTGTDSNNELNIELLSTNVPGVILTPQSLTINGDQGGSNQPDFTILDTQSGGVRLITSSGGLNGGGVVELFPAGAISSITIQPLGGNNTVVLDGVPQGVTVTIQSTGSDFVDIGNGSLSNIQGSVTIKGTGQDFVQVDDSKDTSTSTATLKAGSLDFNGTTSLVSWSGLQNLIQLNYNGGKGSDTIHVLATTAPTCVVGGSGVNIFNIGSMTPGAAIGSLANLLGVVTVAGGAEQLEKPLIY